MKFLQIILVATLLLLAGCTGDNDSRPGAVNEVATDAAPEMLLENMTRRLLSEWEEGNTDNALQFYSLGASVITPEGRTLSGVAEIRSFRSAPVSSSDLEVEKVVTSPTLGHLWMRTPTAIDTSSAGASPVHLLVLFRKNEETEWKIVLEAWK